MTGLSMGGGGTIQAVSVAPDLFAAALPICPSMNGESYAQLLHWPGVSGMDFYGIYGLSAWKACVSVKCM